MSWKKQAEELEAEVRRLRSYAFDYGNATGECTSGYLQQRGLICHKCGADDYREGCGLTLTSGKPARKNSGGAARGKANP